MLQKKSNAFRVAEAALGKVTKVSKPVWGFVLDVLALWLGMNCRYVFTNMQRWGGKSEKSYRSMFSKVFDWLAFNCALVGQHCSDELIGVFDPTYLKKSGSKTYGVGTFWSGTACRALRGLEVGCLCFVDVVNQTAMQALAVQTPSPKSLKVGGQTLIDHYVRVLEKYIDKIKALSRYLVVDGYFFKRAFIHPLVKKGLQIITKARKDANLRYLYKGQKHKGKGRPRLYEGKVDTRAIDKRKIRCLYQDKEKRVYAAPLYAVQLKQKVLAAFVYYTDKQPPQIIISTDVEMDALRMCRYYGLRFQVEFLIRDAKQHTGLADAQARSKKKLHTHFNLSMTAVSVAKAAYYLSVPKEQRGSFSMADIKMMHMNQLITNRIFSNLELDLSSKKIKHIYHQCLNFARIRA